MKRTFRIAEISAGRPQWDVQFRFQLNDAEFEVQRFGTNFSVPAMQDLIKTMRNQVDAFSISGLPNLIRIDNTSFIHNDYFNVMGTPAGVPLCDGSQLRAMGNINAIHNLIQQGSINPNEGIYFPTAVMNMEILNYFLKNYPKSIYLGDFTSMVGFPFLVKKFPGFEEIAKLGLTLSNFKTLKEMAPGVDGPFKTMARENIRPQLENIRYFFSELGYLMLQEGQAKMIENKDLIIFSHHEGMLNKVKSYRPRNIFNLFPNQFAVSPYMNYAVLDAALRLSFQSSDPLNIEQCSEILSIDQEVRQLFMRSTYKRKESLTTRFLQAKKSVKEKISSEKAPDFAFVVHVLSRNDLLKAPGLSLMKHAPLEIQKKIESGVSHLPGIVYGKVKHVISKETGKEINGIVYALWSTPKMLKETPPEVTYKKIEALCEHAANSGAKVIGLGAYTKIIGDSGFTINRNSPIPVTTGNSLSASATVWALYDVLDRMGMIQKNSETGRYEGVGMVIGATGSIGRVSAKLMSEKFEKLILVAPKIDKLKDLKDEIAKISPDCLVEISTSANLLAGEVDALVTATSSIEEKVIDIEKLKPGAVVSDCSRPLDFSMDDVKKRPDVLVVESGEIVLPGPVEVTCDIGLNDNVVYACLAETAVLALEEMYEPFTLGRDIDFAKAKLIYELALKHGLSLASIRGHSGLISDREIQLTKELALKKLAQKEVN